MPSHDIIVIGGSTGSITALKQICRDLPSDLPAAVLIVVHIGSEGPNALAGILGANAALPVSMAEDGQPIECGRIYVAPANHHLLVEKDVVRLGRGPRENMTRPAIDPLFRSAAVAFGSRVIGVVLTGHLNDGSAGLAALKRCGGLAVVQSPSDAEAADMPIGALQACDVDYKAPAAEIGVLLARLALQPAKPAPPVPNDIALEAGFALGRPSNSTILRQIATPTTAPCPDCGGVLSEVQDAAVLRFRCQIGHAYSAECLNQQLDRPVQEALGVALRTLDARATLLERMAEDARSKARTLTASEFDDRAKDYRRDAETIREALLREERPPGRQGSEADG